MKRIFMPLALASLCGGIALAGGNTMTVGSTVYDVDTVFHAKVGPGTIQTQLRLTGPSNSLDVFYLTVDLTTPNLSIRALSGGDKVAGNGTTSSMAKNHTTDGLHYFAGTNGDFYHISGTATNGSSMVGTPNNACTIDREVFRTNDWMYSFTYDMDALPWVGSLNNRTGSATCGEASVPFSVVNNESADNGVSLYTSKFWGSTNQTQFANNCAEVTAKLVDGDNFYAGCSYRLEVTSEPSRTGDLTIPANGFVLHGRGAGDSFISNLHPGDVVTIDNVVLTDNGTQIQPRTVIGGFPKTVQNGANLRLDGVNTDRNPRTGIGYTEDRTKVIMLVVDGRTNASVGVSTDDMGDLMVYAGCYEGTNLDGGGSTTLYTEALGVRNHCSDGKERAVGNAIYAVLEAPEDNEVAELAFYDYNPTLPHLGMYTPRVMAFNKYGLCIDTDFTGYTLSCPGELGEIINEGHTLYITGDGYYALTATCGDATVSIPVSVSAATEVELLYPSVVIDETHSYTIQLFSIVGKEKMPLNPAALSWHSADTSIATVDENGIVTAVADGTVQIIGTIGDAEVSQTILVQNPPAPSKPVATAEEVAEWSFTKTSLKDVAIAPFEDGVALDYTVSSTRGTRLTVNSGAKTYGIPESFRFVVKPGEAKLTKFTVNLRSANVNAVVPVEFPELASGETTEIVVPFADSFDAADMGIYPIELVSFSMAIGDASKTVSHIDIPAIEAVYPAYEGVTDIVADRNAAQLCVNVADGRAYLAAPAATIVLTDLSGRVIATSAGQSIALPDGHGIAILVADGQAAKLAY